jgi:hypothetical protein
VLELGRSQRSSIKSERITGENGADHSSTASLPTSKRSLQIKGRHDFMQMRQPCFYANGLHALCRPTAKLLLGRGVHCSAKITAPCFSRDNLIGDAIEICVYP